MDTAKIQQLLDAVPDIGDQRAREVTIARMAYEAGQAAERDFVSSALVELTDLYGTHANSALIAGDVKLSNAWATAVAALRDISAALQTLKA